MAKICECGHRITEHYQGPPEAMRCAVCDCLVFKEGAIPAKEVAIDGDKYVATFEQVVEAIASERVYQSLLWDDVSSGGKHSVTEWLVFMQDYVKEALHDCCRNAAPDCDTRALHIVRKIAGMAVACMQENGVQEREIPEDMTEAFAKHGIIKKSGGA